MKRKRLDRDLWGFSHFPYYQMRLDCEEFHGIACVIKLTSGETCFWNMKSCGRTPVCSGGMTWLELIPDGKNHLITAMFLPENRVLDNITYPHRISVCYVDVIAGFDYDPDGVIAYKDEYLDVIFNIQGDVYIDDKDELYDAYKRGELSKVERCSAMREADSIVRDYTKDLEHTEELLMNILKICETNIENGLKDMKQNSRM